MTNVQTIASSPQFFRLLSLGLTNSPVPTAPGVYGALYMVADGIPRHYRLNIPANYNAATSAPLALILHGHDQTAVEFAGNHPDLATYANGSNVILVLPDSTRNERGTGWNDFDPIPGELFVNDGAFLIALIDRLSASLNVDNKRTYVAGFSNGGQMSHYMVSRTTNVFSAIGAVGSAIAGEHGTPGALITNPPPSGPISAMIVNATNDCKRPFLGGTNEDGQLMPPVAASVAHYTNANTCAPPPTLLTNLVVSSNIFRFAATCVTNKPPASMAQTNLVIREWYQTCYTNTEVILYALTDGGHNWPDADDHVGFDSNFRILEFFLRHVLP